MYSCHSVARNGRTPQTKLLQNVSKTHLLPAFDGCQLRDLTRERLQRFLDGKTKDGLSKSVVSHLRWDLNAVFKMAADDGLIHGNAAGSLVTPKEAKTFEKYDQGGNPFGVVSIGSPGTDRILVRRSGRNAPW